MSQMRSLGLVSLLLAVSLSSALAGGQVSITDYGGSPWDPGPGNDAAFQKAYAAVGNRGVVWIPPADGCYTVTASVKPPLGVSLNGAGYDSCITIPPEGWPVVYNSAQDYAIVLLRHSHQRVTNLRIRGSLTCTDVEHCPKPLGVYPVGKNIIENVLIRDALLHNSRYEALHPNMDYGTYQIRGLRVLDNELWDVGLNAADGKPNAGFGIEMTCDECQARGNRIQRSASGIAAYGSGVIVSENILECIPSLRAGDWQSCLYSHGEGNPRGGPNILAKNRITIRPSALNVIHGIRLSDTGKANLPDLVIGNVIEVDDAEATQNGWGIYSTATMGKLSGNQILLQKRGIGILANGTQAGSQMEIQGTTVRLIGETGGSIGIFLRNLQKTHSLRAKVNDTQVYGFSANSLPYYYKKDIGTVTVNEAGNTKTK